MQYLSNEKDKLNNKLQSAIKLLESNGLFNQYQQIVNESATILMTQSNNNNTIDMKSLAGKNQNFQTNDNDSQTSDSNSILNKTPTCDLNELIKMNNQQQFISSLRSNSISNNSPLMFNNHFGMNFNSNNNINNNLISSYTSNSGTNVKYYIIIGHHAIL